MQCPHIMSAKINFLLNIYSNPINTPPPSVIFCPMLNMMTGTPATALFVLEKKQSTCSRVLCIARHSHQLIIIILMRSSNLGEINPRGRALHKQHHQESARHHRTSDHRGTSHQYACTMWILWGVPGGGEAGQALPSSPSQTKVGSKLDKRPKILYLNMFWKSEDGVKISAE